MIGGFRKNSKRGNIRKKVVTEDDDEEEADETKVEEESAATANPVAPVAAPALPALPPSVNKVKSISKKTSLSFGEELEKEDEFVLKRSKASLTLQEQVKREKKMKKQKNNDLLIQSRGSPNESRPNEVKAPPQEEKSGAEGFVLKQTQIPFSTNTILNAVELDDEDTPVQNGDYNKAEHHFSVRKKAGKEGAIPDAATIYAMKKKREQARHGGPLPAYIPLDNKHDGRFATGSSRLVREGDSSDEERIEMRGTNEKSHPALERRKQVAKALEEIEERTPDVKKDEDEDDEILAWEDEQMKKGSKIPTNQQPVKRYGPQLPDTKVTATVVPPVGNPNMYNMAMGIPPVNYAGFYSACGVPPANEQKVVTVEIVEQRLQEQLQTKRQLFRLHELQCEKTKFELDSSQENIVTLERKAEDISDRFTFYQDIRGYIKDLLECLGEKVKRIDEIEDSMHVIYKKQAAKLTTRRLNDVKDEVDELSGKGNADSDRIAHLKSRRITEREARRSRRREERRKTPNLVHNEGMSSDDEILPGDKLRFDADREKVIRDSEMVFTEVVEDFSSIRQIMSRFEQWKFAFNDSYKDAYLGLCLPKLFSPYLKLELLNWNPLEVESPDYEEYDWFKALVLYGYHEDEIDASDDDINLVPNIIEKTLLPKLTVLLRDVWDPLSSKQTKVITFLLQRLIDDYPSITKDSKTTQTLVDTIITRLSNSVENEIYIPLYARSVLEAEYSPALIFLERQFWKGVKLLQNLLEWNWLLSRKKILELGVDAILNRYLIIALQQFVEPMSTFDKAKFIINILPKEWFEKSDKIVVGMQSFARFLNGLAATCHKEYLAQKASLDQCKMKITIKKIISLLMHIQAFDEAKVVSNSYAVRKDTESPTTL